MTLNLVRASTLSCALALAVSLTRSVATPAGNDLLSAPIVSGRILVPVASGTNATSLTTSRVDGAAIRTLSDQARGAQLPESDLRERPGRVASGFATLYLSVLVAVSPAPFVAVAMSWWVPNREP